MPPQRAGVFSVFVLALVLAACERNPVPSDPFDPIAWAEAERAWREQRAASLQRPDGWLSLVGLHWVEEGSHTVGSAEGNGIRLATGPAVLGVIAREDGQLRFAPEPEAGVTIDGQRAPEAVRLAVDPHDAPTVVGFDDGRASFLAIERSGRLGLRVRDVRANTLVGFAGLDWFALDPGWRVEARFEPHEEGRTIDIANVIGSLDAMPNPGALVFEKDGRAYRLEAIREGERLFLIFADRSNGDATYGAGRFLYADWPMDGRVLLDFNRAYNPPCAFNAHSTCPLPPPENRLDVRVEAGEKRYTGPTS